MKRQDHKKSNVKIRFPGFPGEKRNCRHGSTLVELMVSVGIGLFLFAAVFVIDILAKNTFEFSLSFIEINSGARVAMDWLTKDIRWADHVVDSRTVGSKTYATADDEIIFEIPSIDGSGNIISGTYDYVIYHLDDTVKTKIKLERIIDVDVLSSRVNGARIITGNINTLNFSSGGIGLSSIGDVTTLTQIEIALAAGRTASSGQVINQNLSSVVELRNKEW
jgi:hypothetical protein